MRKLEDRKVKGEKSDVGSKQRGKRPSRSGRLVGVGRRESQWGERKAQYGVQSRRDDSTSLFVGPSTRLSGVSKLFD